MIPPSVPAFDHVLLGRALHAAVRLHHHVRGPKGDYIGLGAAALASWAGLPGPGEAALIAAGLLAADGHLSIVAAVVVAWVGATIGGTMGWAVGLRAGRAVLTAPGPLHHARLAALERGDRFFTRFGALAVFFTPSWVAGIHAMRPARYLPANAVSALIWALGVGLGAFYAGPPIVDIVGDLGVVSAIVVGALVVSAVAGALVRRSRR